MAEQLNELIANWHWSALLATVIVSVLALGKGADWLVEEAVAISLRSGVPRAIVGATVVSLGTTAPEAAVSVLAALQGNPGLALGNSVGSIICDTGLILGLACLISPIKFDPAIVNRQGWVQLGCGVLLVAVCFPWSAPATALAVGGTMSQIAGFVFLGLLVAYIGWSVRMAKSQSADDAPENLSSHSMVRGILHFLIAIAIVLVSSTFLIASATELAERMQIPPAIIAATLVAFGTSLPELMIVLTATLKGHGEIAVGNVIGADILNVLFVAGAAAAVTPAGLHADPAFFRLQFPAMLFVLFAFRLGIWAARDGRLSRQLGAFLLLVYVAVTVASFVLVG
ncbi:MAG TPA: sodium:calcium antiporter [Pirellulaceae bacterium]|jgi:cation:H+ antiporter|nr:sodium:calcium antiporter [Pirellulaceae bacterium]